MAGPRPLHQAVLVFKTSSVSTKCRIVSISALINSRSGLSLNGCMWAGPMALVELLAVLIPWRTIEVALMVDIVKVYHIINTREHKLHLRRFLHRDLPHEPWRVCAYTCTTFGMWLLDSCSRWLNRRQLTKAKALNLSQPSKSGTTRACKEEVVRMKENKQENGQCDGTVTQVLATGGMVPKLIAVLGNKDPAQVVAMGGKVLGLGYYMGQYEVVFKLNFNFYVKVRNRKDICILTSQDLRDVLPNRCKLSRQVTLLIQQGWFNPLGLICHALLKGKMMLRRLHTPGTTWDTDIPSDKKWAWVNWLRKIDATEPISFPRSTRPQMPEVYCPSPPSQTHRSQNTAPSCMLSSLTTGGHKAMAKSQE